jgi:hypothetical protein
VVHLEGAGRYISTIVATYDFPTNRSLIEWENVHARAYEQRIANLALICPYVSGTHAIHYKLNDGSTRTKVDEERLQIIMESVYIVGTNQYQESLIKMEGMINDSRFINITADPWTQSHTYDTLLFDTDYLINGEEPENWDSIDSPGLFHCVLENIYAGWVKGGSARLFKGRMVYSTLRNAICEKSYLGPCLDFYYSYANTIEGLSNEGGGEQPMYRFTDCKFNVVRAMGLGWSHDQGAGVGNGLELIRCSDNRFSDRATGVGNPTYSSVAGDRLVVIDVDSRRNIFSNWGVIASGGDVDAEFQIDADIAYGNRIEYVDTVSNTTGVLTGS